MSSISPVIVEDEYTEATESGLGPFIGLALLLIAALLLLFTRTVSDMLLTLAGLSFQSRGSSERKTGWARMRWE